MQQVEFTGRPVWCSYLTMPVQLSTISPQTNALTHKTPTSKHPAKCYINFHLTFLYGIPDSVSPAHKVKSFSFCGALFWWCRSVFIFRNKSGYNELVALSESEICVRYCNRYYICWLVPRYQLLHQNLQYPKSPCLMCNYIHLITMTLRLERRILKMKIVAFLWHFLQKKHNPSR